MSSMNPSLLFLKRNLRRSVEDSSPLFHHRHVQNNWLDVMGFVPPTINWAVNDIMSHFNRNASIAYFANPRLTICKFSVRGFKLEELTVRIENGFIVIRGCHGEKRDKYGLISRIFTRRVAIPRDVIEDEIRAQLFSNGILSITGKKRFEISEIPIQQIKPTSFKTKEQSTSSRTTTKSPNTNNF